MLLLNACRQTDKNGSFTTNRRRNSETGVINTIIGKNFSLLTNDIKGGPYWQTVTEPSSLTLPPFSPTGLSHEARKGKKAFLLRVATAVEESSSTASDSTSFGGED